MKKARLFLFFALIVTLALLLLVGCNKKDDNITSISLKDHDPNSVIEMALGSFDYDAYTLVVVYDSESTEELPLTEEMIAETDQFKFYQEGEHDITLTYGEHKYTFKIDVKRSTFGALAFSKNNVFTYDGKAHTIEVEGDIPANAVVTYLDGNSFVNAGTYDVIAVVSCEGYVTETLATTMKIERAKYDMSGVKFEGKEVVYDGNPHSVAISGTLPEGVSSPTYTINGKTGSSATDAGEYTVTATFVNNDPNYEAIPEMEAILKITPAEYAVSNDLDIVFRSENGNIISDATKIYDGKSITFDLNDYNKLSKHISVSFVVYDKDGNVISNSNKITNIKNAGVYTVKVEFTLSDGKNYRPIPPLVRTFEVFKAEYPTVEDIRFVSAQTTYDGKEHSIVITGQLPEGVTVSYEYYYGNTLIVDDDGKPVQSVIDTGIYMVKAVFTHKDENLGKIPDASAILNIQKAEFDVHNMVGFFGENSVVYSGQPYEPIFKTWKDSIGLDYDVLQYSAVKYYVYDSNSGTYVEMGTNERPIAVGLYRVAIDISIADEYKNNYVLTGGFDVQTLVKQFEILKKEIEIPSVDFTSELEWNYTGAAKEIKYICNTDENVTTVSTRYFKYTAGEYVAMNNGEIPLDKGWYKFVVTVTMNDVTSYVFSNGETREEFSFKFKILPKEIDVSDIDLSYKEVTYNESNQLPSLTGLPAHVNATVKFYSISGTTPIVEAVNAGKYRCEVILAAESSNYVLSTNETFIFEFEILPITIDVSNLGFDDVEFEYNGNQQQPSLKDIPAHVRTTVMLHLIGYDTTPVDAAINAGKYSYKIVLWAENSNYVLSGQTTYSTEFNILKKTIANLDELLTTDIEISLIEGGYDDTTLSEAIVKAIFGDMSQHVECLVGSIQNIDTGAYVTQTNTIEAGVRYRIKCRLDVIDDGGLYNYNFFSEGRACLGKELYICFKFN